MTSRRNKRIPPAVQAVPVTRYDDEAAKTAYFAYIGLLAHEYDDPSLRDNRDWQWLKRIAFDRFNTAFVAP